MPRKCKYDVFVSYSRRDFTFDNNLPDPDSIVSHILRELDAADISYWIDKEGVYSGEKFQGVICGAIEESRVLLFVSSEASNNSQWTPGEIQTAVDLKMPIVPFRIDDTLYNRNIRLSLAPIDRIEYFTLGDKAFPLLIKSLKEHIDRIKEEEAAEQRRIEEQRRENEKDKKAEAERRRRFERCVAAIELINEDIARAIEKKKKKIAELEATGFPMPDHLQGADSPEVAALQKKIDTLNEELEILQHKYQKQQGILEKKTLCLPKFSDAGLRWCRFS